MILLPTTVKVLVPEQDKEQNSLMIVKGSDHLRRNITPQMAAWAIIRMLIESHAEFTVLKYNCCT